MAERAVDFAARESVPGTPGIREVRPDSGADSFGFASEVGAARTIRKVGLRAEIDTSPPFGSVREAVTRFGGSESWPPLYKLGEAFQGVEEFDIKKVEEQAAELEKDLIVKELETLDVLEELGTTKKIVEELKLQLQKEAMKCMVATPDEQVSTPAIKEISKEHCRNYGSNSDQMAGNSSPCPVSSPDLILMELKQAKLNLGRTITDLGVIQTSVESLNKRMKKEKILLEKTRERLASKFPAEVKKTTNVSKESFHMNSHGEQFKNLVEVSRAMSGNEQSKVCIKTAEMRWIAAKKMEEAAKAAEALAFAEIKALSGGNNTPGFLLPEPEKITAPYEDPHQSPLPKNKVLLAMPQLNEADISKFSILKMIEDAAAEVKHSKQVMEEAFNRVEIANRKQLAAGEALRRWSPDYDKKGQGIITYSPHRLNIFNPCEYQQGSSPLNEVNKPNFATNEAEPVLRPTVSMRDILSRKQVHQAEECVVRRQTEGHNERQKVALSQMLQELREDLTFPKKPDINNCDEHQKQFFAQRRKFGFIHISLPLTKQSKKKMQPLNAI